MTPIAPQAQSASVRLTREFDDNKHLQVLFGPRNANLDRMERQLGVSLDTRGNAVTITGPSGMVEAARSALDALYDRIRRGHEVEMGDVDAAVRMSRHGVASMEADDDALGLRTRKRHVEPRSPTQAEYLRAMRDNDLVFGLGPAGTGKTYLAVAMAVSMMLRGQVDRLILSRPAVEAGERLGFLPGDLRDKVDPYLRPLYDALYDMLPGDQVMKRLASGEIEVAPLAFMRGRTLASAFVILDEAQNTTPVQMKMFLTRLGENSRMVVTGDMSQIDLPSGARSGLRDAIETLQGVESVAFIRFTDRDVVRHDLVTRIVRAYQAREGGDSQ
ncbi:MAG: PhoH family protein [Alphaproteobacteria bacterium]